MSDRTREHLEDRAIELALSQVTAGGEPRRSVASDGADAALVREYTELLGLLPYELAAEVPPARIKEQILARAAGRQSAGAAESAGEAAVVPFQPPARARRPVWAFAQAAALAASLVGLGFLSAVVWQQNRQIGQLHGQLAATTLQQGEAAQAREELRAVRGRLDMITNVARHAYPMRRVSRNDAARQPEGFVYVCGMHQQWYLSLHGLEPPADGGEYHLWFMTEEGKVDGGTLEVRSDSPTEMEARTMPEGTHGFQVTLERQDQPEGLTVLLGENPINL